MKKTAVKAKPIFHLLLFLLVLAPNIALADTVAQQPLVQENRKNYVCLPTENSEVNLSTCINNIYLFSIGLAGFVAVLMFVYAGYLYMTGTAGSIKDAKDIMMSTIVALLILFGAYAFFNTINPGLTSISGIKLPEYEPPKIGTKIPGGGDGTVTPAARSLAQEIFQMHENSRIILATAHAESPPDEANAAQNIVDTTLGNPARRTLGGTAPGGTVALNETMLRGLLSIVRGGVPITSIGVSEIAGGVHTTENSRHYSGLAFDVNRINGRRVADLGASDSLVQAVINRCRAGGAGGSTGLHNGNHIHCEW